MTAQFDMPWSELFELHVIKKVAKLVNRRWNLGLGYADARFTLPPKTNEFARSEGLCQLVQSIDAGEHACGKTGRATFERFSDEAVRGVLRTRPITLTCHAGLTEIGAPILVGGDYVGALYCGGFVMEDERAEEALSAASRAADRLGIAAIDLPPARDAHPRLSRREVSFVGELVEEAAAEAAAYLTANSRHRRRRRRATNSPRDTYDSIIGRSDAMQDLYDLLDKVVASDSTVLITGENGTGKELVAKAIHRNSMRKSRRFVVQNCSAFNDNLLDSELFGHKRGSFTGAIADKQGLFEVADQGTFFLDEIGDMSPSLQVKVLRVLQEGTFTAVGDTDPKKVDVRIIAATNRDLKAMVDRGEFREDLFYRINVINLVLPPLRTRTGDIEMLVEHFLDKHGGRGKRLSEGCIERMLSYSWPGNVRELENEIERLVVLCGSDPIIAESLLSPRIGEATAGAGRPPNGERETRSLPAAVRALERRMILAALERHDWNKTRAAQELQISRRNLIRLVQKYELETGRSPSG